MHKKKAPKIVFYPEYNCNAAYPQKNSLATRFKAAAAFFFEFSLHIAIEKKAILIDVHKARKITVIGYAL